MRLVDVVKAIPIAPNAMEPNRMFTNPVSHVQPCLLRKIIVILNIILVEDLQDCALEA